MRVNFRGYKQVIRGYQIKVEYSQVNLSIGNNQRERLW